MIGVGEKSPPSPMIGSAIYSDQIGLKTDKGHWQKYPQRVSYAIDNNTLRLGEKVLIKRSNEHKTHGHGLKKEPWTKTWTWKEVKLKEQKKCKFFKKKG